MRGSLRTCASAATGLVVNKIVPWSKAVYRLRAACALQTLLPFTDKTLGFALYCSNRMAIATALAQALDNCKVASRSLTAEYGVR
jgi:hypothetical protein